MPGLVPGIHAFLFGTRDVDGRVKPGHDEMRKNNKGEENMKLTPQQIEFFHREGWLFLPELFSQEEVDFLAREAVSIYDTNRPEVWREKSGAPHAAHRYKPSSWL